MSQSDLPSRVVMLTHEFYPSHGGIATHVEEIAFALSEQGVDTSVWAPSRPELERKLFAFTVKGVALRGTQDWDCRLKLAAALVANRQSWRDAVLYLPEPGPIRTWQYFQFLRRYQPASLVVTLHGSELEHLVRAPHRRYLLHRLLRQADRIGVVSNYVRERLLQRFPDLASQVVLALGADRTGSLVPDASLLSAPNVALDLPRPWRLLTVGRVHPRKGQAAVVEALAGLPAEQKSRIEYRIVGPIGRDSYRAEILAKANAAQVAISFAGAVSETVLEAEYRQAHAFALTSMPAKRSVEGFGLVYLEAGARGLPVVAHRIGGVEDAVSDQVTGFLVDPGDRPALSDVILRLAVSPALCNTMGEAGRVWAKSFSWRRTAGQLFGGLPGGPDRG